MTLQFSTNQTFKISPLIRQLFSCNQTFKNFPLIRQQFSSNQIFKISFYSVQNKIIYFLNAFFKCGVQISKLLFCLLNYSFECYEFFEFIENYSLSRLSCIWVSRLQPYACNFIFSSKEHAYRIVKPKSSYTLLWCQFLVIVMFFHSIIFLKNRICNPIL